MPLIPKNVVHFGFFTNVKIRTGRLDLTGSTGRPKNVTQSVERKMIKSVYDNPQSSTRGLTLQVEKDRVTCFYETIRNVLEKHKHSSRVARKNPSCRQKM